MSWSDNLILGLLLLQGTHKFTSEFRFEPVFNIPVYPEFVYRLTYQGFEPLYELEAK